MRHKHRFSYGNMLFHSSYEKALFKGILSIGLISHCRWPGEKKEGDMFYFFFFAEAVFSSNDFLETNVLIARLFWQSNTITPGF